MRKQDLVRFRKVLEERLVKLYNQAHGKVRQGMTRETFDQNEPRDEADEAQRVLVADTALAMSEREAGLAIQIEAALERITRGVFGECMDCGQPIEMQRLKLVPWATRCIADQEAHEFEGRDLTPSL